MRPPRVVRQRPQLHAVPDLPEEQTRPLPVAWDGLPVTWGEWEQDQTTFSLHAELDQLACGKCGGLHGHEYSTGFIKDSSLQPRRLFAARCAACGHDTVSEHQAGEWVTWDLDETDYTSDGSWEPGQGTLL